MRRSYLPLATALLLAGVVAASATAQSTPSATPAKNQDGQGQNQQGQGTQGQTTTTPASTTATPDGDGDDQPGSGATETTAAAPGAGDTAAGTGSSPAPAVPAPAPALPPAGPPVLGSSVRVAPDGGTVTVQLPRSHRFVSLSRVAALPTGAVVDARRGHIRLTSALDRSGHTQTGTFWGGRFVVAQGRTRRSRTQLSLSGEHPRAVCGTATGSGVHAKRRRGVRVLARVWGRDHHGLFSTRGRFAAAVVRGTEWLTEDRCDGTLIVVRHGAVTVNDLRRHRTVLVRAGHRYLARAGR